MIRIFIVDDHALIREGIKRILSKTPDIEVVGEAENGQELFKKAGKDTLNFDILLLDIALPGRSGLDILKQIKISRPAVKVLMLSVMSEEEYAIRAIRNGASGFMRKDSAPDLLIDGIRKIYQGGKYISPELAERLADLVGYADNETLHQKLSDREFQVLTLLASGKTVSEIAVQLSLSVKTISNFRSRILKKMGMSTTAQLIHYAIEHDLTY